MMKLKEFSLNKGSEWEKNTMREVVLPYMHEKSSPFPEVKIQLAMSPLFQLGSIPLSPKELKFQKHFQHPEFFNFY